MEKFSAFLKSWPGKVLLVLTMLPMFFLGLEGYFSQGRMNDGQIAKVGEKMIELNSVQSEVNDTKSRLLESVDPSLINEDVLFEQTLKNVINRALLEEQAAALGMKVSDEAISAMLSTDPMFLDANGKFSNDLFAQFMQQQGLTKDRLFAMQRSQLNLRTLMNGILSTAIYPSSQVNRLIDLQLESRPLWVKRLNWQNYADQVTVSDSDIAQYYEAHKDTLISPAMVDLSYIELTADAIEVPAPTDDELKQAYQAYLTQNNMGQKQLSQILLTGDKAGERAKEVADKLAKNEAFESLAKQYSDDPSGKSGGDIGVYNSAVFGADASKVDTALAGLAVGQVSQPVQTSFGVHIFKVTGMDKAPSLDELKPTLTTTVLEQKRKALFGEKISQINNMVVEGFGIKDIASEVNLPIKELKNYQDKNQEIMGQPAIAKAAFDEAIIAEGGVSANIDVAGASIWLQPSNHRASAPMTLEQASGEIKQTLTVQKASELALADAKKQAQSIDKAGLSALTDVGVVTRQNDVLSDEERASLFITDVAKDSKEGIVGWAVQTKTGASIMVGGAIETQAQAQMGEQEKAAAANMMKNVLGQDYLEDYLHYLRTVHPVEMNDKVAKSL